MENKLISMCEYIELQESEVPLIPYTPTVKDMDRIFVQRTILYMRFLKQPLELWMFVPCGEDGNVLNKSTMSEDTCEDDCNHKNCVSEMNECIKYQEAKDRVLFNNVEYVESKKEDDYSFFRIAELSQINYPKFWENYTIEDLVKYNLVLTPTALKQIGYELIRQRN